MSPNQFDETVKQLTEARYKMLVAIRPIAPAKSAWNLAVSALIQSTNVFDDEQRKTLAKLLLEETL